MIQPFEVHKHHFLFVLECVKRRGKVFVSELEEGLLSHFMNWWCLYKGGIGGRCCFLSVSTINDDIDELF